MQLLTFAYRKDILHKNAESTVPLSATSTHTTLHAHTSRLKWYNNQSMPTIQREVHVSEIGAFPSDLLKVKVITGTMTQRSASSAHVVAGVGNHMWQVW